MGLFSKKYCDVCGEKIGLLGNRKLEDGNLCKDCAKKLSPWFDDRRHSTVEEIKEQLAWREANRDRVRNFHITRTMGTQMKLLLDEDAGRFAVTSARDLEEANPDVLELSDVTGCRVDSNESRRELMRETKDGEGHIKRVSFNPKRYDYTYDFYVTINVNAPYFDEIRFKLNNEEIAIREVVERPGFRLNPRENALYLEYEKQGKEIERAMTKTQRTIRREAEEAVKPKTSVTCPCCGATTLPDANNRCEYCGGALGG